MHPEEVEVVEEIPFSRNDDNLIYANQIDVNQIADKQTVVYTTDGITTNNYKAIYSFIIFNGVYENGYCLIYLYYNEISIDY